LSPSTKIHSNILAGDISLQYNIPAALETKKSTGDKSLRADT